MKMAIIALLALALAGACGGGTDDATDADATAEETTTTVEETTTTVEVMTKDEFLERANAICGEMNSTIDAIEAEYPPDGPQTGDEVAAAMDDTVAAIDESLAGLRGLPQPAGDEDLLAAMYDQVEELRDLGEDAAAAARAGDQETFSDLGTEIEELSASTNEEFADYGLDICAES